MPINIIFTILIVLAAIILIGLGFTIGWMVKPTKCFHSEWPTTYEGIQFSERVAKATEDVFKRNNPELDYVQPGVVYRPTAEELHKMHEDEVTKASKDAVAATLSREQPPQI